MNNNSTTKLVTYRTLIVSIILVCLSIFIIFLGVALRKPPGERLIDIIGTILEFLGGSLFVIASVSLIWDLFLKRDFLHEILEKSGISRDINLWGIEKITDSFHEDIDWKSLIQNSNKIDIFFAYGRTWRSTHEADLRQAAENKDVCFRVVLPDPDSQQLLSELARRFNLTTDEVKQRIEEAFNFFRDINHKNDEHGAAIKIWYLPESPVFSFYCFDSIGILALYKHKKERGSVPTIVCKKGGSLYEFIKQEFDVMIDTATPMARRIL
ncbi:MAG: hypothetical protein ABII09_12570 [Planctomycetota bacterium]